MVLVASATAIYQPAKAQVSLQINIGSQPNWGPRGYDHVDYYYRKSLPARYRNYDLYQGRKIVINEQRPYLQHHVYQSNYTRQNVRYAKNRRNDYQSYNTHERNDKRNKHDKGNHKRKH